MPTPVVLIYRDSLSLGPLTLGNDALPFVGGEESDQALLWSGTSWDRAFVNSPWVNGEMLVNARKRNTQLEMRFMCVADDEDGVRALYDEVEAAFNQFNYLIDVIIGTQTYQMRGWVADTSLGFGRPHLKAFAARMVAIVPVLPIGIGR